MAESFTLDAQPRVISGKKVSQLRNQGLVPAVVYGAKIDPVNIQIPYRPLQVALMHAGGTHLIDLNVNGATHSVLAREVQRHLILGEIIHVDFIAVAADEMISTEVPVHFVGESLVVERRQGMLMHFTSTVKIEALPRNLISEIQVDVSGLKEIGDAIYVRDLNLGDTITILSDPDEMLVRAVAIASASALEETPVEFTSAEPELVSRRREEEVDED